MKLYQYILLLIAVVCISSCTPDEAIIAESPSTALDGKYNWESTVVSKPVDLDFDGSFSVDLMAEAHQQDKTETYFLQLETIEHPTPSKTYYDQRMFLWTPYPNVFSDQNGQYLSTEYGFANLLAGYRFDEKKSVIEILDNLAIGIVQSARLVDPDRIVVKYTQGFYTTNGWEDLTLTSTYKRVE